MTRHRKGTRPATTAIVLAVTLAISFVIASAGPAGALSAALLCGLVYGVGARQGPDRLWMLLAAVFALLWLEVAVTEVAIRLA